MNKKYRLDAADTVLVVVDIQEKLMKAMDQREKVYKNINLLLCLAEQLGLPVVVTEQYPRGLGATVAEIKANLKDFRYMDKIEYSAIAGLRDILSDLDRRTILMTGSETHVCVFQTTRDLLEEGYDVQVVRDGVCSRTNDNYLNGLELMRDIGAVITNTETVLFDLMKAAGTSVFKVISTLLK